MDVGGDLRRARTARTLSLDDIAARTKINSKILRAIEDNRFDRVPGGLFTRGYLRAYAREVELDPEEVVDRYRAEYEPPAPPPDPSIEEPRFYAYVESIMSDVFRDKRRVAGQVVVLLIGVAYFGFALNSTPSSLADSSSKPTTAVGVAAAVPNATKTTGSVDAAQVAPLKLTITARGDCWVAGTVDGKAAIARLMRAGDRDQFEVHDRASLRIGDPAAFSFTLDGIAGRALGKAGTAVNLTFDRQSYKSVLAERPQ